MNKLLEIDTRERLVRVQSGITLKELNTALSVSGLKIPIEGRDEETIGGLISNASVDEAMGKYGGIANYVERIEVVLTNGECLQTERLKRYAVAKAAAEKSFLGNIYQKVSKLLHDTTCGKCGIFAGNFIESYQKTEYEDFKNKDPHAFSKGGCLIF